MKKRNLVFLLAIFSLAFVPFVEVNAVDTKVEVSGYSEDGTTLLAGVTLQVLDEDKNVVVDSIQTDGTSFYDVTQFVEENKQYYLHELAPPTGYAPGADVQFTVQPNQEQQYGVVNKPLYLIVNKVDDNGDYVEGALLELKKVSTGEVIDSWTSSGNGGYVVDSSKLEYGETYQIVETRVPVGYLAYELTKTFTIDNENITINFENKELNITIANYDEEGNQFDGLNFQIQDEDENVLEEFLSSTSSYEVNSKLEVGKTYYLVETSVPNGYNIKPKKAFTITDDLNQEYSITNERFNVVVNSLDQNDNVVANVKYNVLNSEGQKLFDFTTGDTSYTFTESQLDDIAYNGTYKIVATGTTDGYILDTTEHEFTINQDSNVVEINHTRIAVTINNYKADNISPLEGAKLQIIKASDNSIVEAEWTTDGNAHTINAILENNTTYKIHQVEAPKGYALADDVTFEVNQDANQLYTIKNDTIKISVLKTDNYNEPLAGALLQLIEKDGNNQTIIDSWTSTLEAYEIPFDKIEGKLDLTKEHILRETTAPTGYNTTADQTITIDSTGELQTFTLSNNPKQKTISIRVYRNGTTSFVNGTELELYEGEEITPEKLVHSWTENNSVERFDTLDSTYTTPALKYGRTYTIHVVSAPEGYVLPEDKSFVLESTTNSNQNIYVKNLALSVSKLDSEDNPLSGARLQLKDGDNVLYSWTTGDSAQVVPSSVIKTMYYDKEYTIHEVSAPNGFAVADDINFKFSDYDTESVNIVMNDSKFAVTINNYDENNDLLAGSTLQIEDESGTTIGNSWVTTDEAYIVPAEVLSQMKYGKKYYIAETDSPAGYGVNTTKKEFTIDSENVNVSFYNFKIGVNIINYDVDGQSLLGKTELQLIDKETDTEIESWDTENSNPHQVSADLEVGKNYIIRIKNPNLGYVFTDDVEFTATSAETQNYSITNKKLSLGFLKYGKDGEPLAGAVLGFYEDGNDEALFTWTSTEENYIVSDEDLSKIDVTKDHYLLEANAPSGYIIKLDRIPVTIDKNSNQLQIIRIENELKTVNALVNVKDKETTDALSGVGIELYEGETKIGTYTTADEDITLSTTGEGAILEYGKSYKLHLSSIPNGYVPSNDIEFTIDDNFENNTVLSFELEKFNITVSKVGKEGALIGGAKLELLKSDGTSIHEFTTVDGESYTVPDEVINQISYGDTIKLREKKAPAGYLLNTTVKDISIDSKDISVDFANTEFGISINNIDKETTNFLAGTKIQLLDETKNNVIEEWVANGVHVVDAKLEQGNKYYLHVVEQANGYIIPNDISFIVSNEQVQEKTIENEKFQLSITKVDENNQPLAGAFLSLYEEGSNNALVSWNSTDDNPYVVPEEILNQMNIANNYVVRETTVPLGYDTVTEDFNVVINNVTTVQNIKIQNNLKQYDVNITAVDEAGNVVEGATIELYEGTYNDNEVIPQNKLITSWSSTSASKKFSTIDGRFDTPKLVFGKSYTIRATKTPRNIEIDNRETFTINENSEDIANKSILAEKFSITINKLDENNQPLAGAKMALYKQDGETEIVRFTTSNNGYNVPLEYINEIQYGDVIKLKELEAPAGYTISDEVKEITIDSNEVNVNYTNTPLQVSVTNVINGTDTKLAGTKLQLLDEDDTVLETWTSSDSSHVISTKLKVGQTYKVHVNTPSTGYRPADDIEYTVTNDENQEITVNNKIIKINITKYDQNGTPLAGATLGLFRKSNDEKLVEFESTESAYEVSNDVILTLDYNTELYVKELEAPAGYVNSDQVVNFTVNYDGNNTDIISVDYSNTALGLSVENLENTDSHTYLAGTVLQLLNEDKTEVVEEWTAPENAAHQITAKVKVGRKYYIHVKTPTTGHIVPDDVEITINNSSEQLETIKNPKFSISVSKLNENDERIEGALLQLKDGNNVIESWTSSTDSAYTLSDAALAQMTVGHTYRVVEVEAPIGYQFTENEIYTDITVENTSVPKEYFIRNNLKVIDLFVDVKNDNTILTNTRLKLVRGTNCNDDGYEWTVGTEPEQFTTKDINNTLAQTNILKYNETYTICEVKAANGYATTDPVEIKIVEDTDSTPNSLNVTLINNPLDIRIKNNITGPETGGENKPLAGVTYGLYKNSNGTNPVLGTNGEPYTWVSSAQPHEVKALLESGVTYYVKEIELPDGYDKSGVTSFVVNDTTDLQLTTVNVQEHPLDVRVKKVTRYTDDNGDEHEIVLKDAVFDLYKAKEEDGQFVVDGDAIYTWTSTEAAACNPNDPYSVECGYHKIPVDFNNDGDADLHVGNYIVRERISPIEYQPELSADTKITIELTNRTQELVINNRKTITDIIINKEESDCPDGDSCPVNGSIIRIHDDTLNGDVYTNVNPDGAPENFPIRLQGLLIPGHKYSIIEDNEFVDANHAYQKAQTFVIDNSDDGHSVLNVESTQTYTLYNDKTIVNASILNKDVYTNEQLKGAVYKIYQGEFGNTEPIENVDDLDPILVWNTDDDNQEHDLSSLVRPGYTYTIVQTKVPYGYKPFEDPILNNSNTFTIENVNTAQDTVINNDKKDINFSINNYASDNSHVIDAHIFIYDKDGNVVDEWYTDGVAHRATLKDAPEGRQYKFNVGEEYTIHQEFEDDSLKELYELFDDFTFEIDDTEGAQPPAGDDLGNIYLENKKLISITIFVLDGKNNTFIPGITFQILDNNGNVILDEEGKPKYEWVSTENGGYTAVGLPAPNTYIIRQKKVPSKYVKEKDIVYNLYATGLNEDVTFVNYEKKVLDNPETGDSIIKFVIIGISSLVAILLGIFIYKKANKKKG